jgi:hypothetical protein
MSGKKNTVSRQQVEGALRAGAHVGFADGRTIRGDQFGRHDKATLDAVFGKDNENEVEAAIIRTPDGHLTRAGMEYQIARGGSVMLGGEVVSSVDDLPDDEALDALRERQEQGQAEALDNQIALLSARRSSLGGSKSAKVTDFGGLPTDRAPTPPAAPPVNTMVPPDYDSMKKDDLAAHAKSRGVEIPSTATKDEMIVALKKADKQK